MSVLRKNQKILLFLLTPADLCEIAKFEKLTSAEEVETDKYLEHEQVIHGLFSVTTALYF